MALLNRIKASTLMETLVATVLIVVIFMVSSMVLNNLLSNKIKENTELVQERIYTLEYACKNNKMELPYYEEYQSWKISIEKKGNDNLITVIAENSKTNKTITSYLIHEK